MVGNAPQPPRKTEMSGAQAALTVIFLFLGAVFFFIGYPLGQVLGYW